MSLLYRKKLFCDMNTVKTMLGLCAVLTLGLMPLQAVAQSGSPARERGEVVICRGVEAHTCGPMVKVGQEAPDFRAVNAALEEVSLSSYRGKRIILNIFPSLDTPACALSVRQFNARASKLENTVVLCLSMDLPLRSPVSVQLKDWTMWCRFRCSVAMTSWKATAFAW